ncbi:hypothetical protein L211DRAFT_479351 [Terfezia boudieri ATCC MYA-4762]|uniref:Uncharacterized protein n=1 Tax=Terfezia boudieri ATCC MYA-4762 TaxID=1051890 RepID=A0A3N4LYY9_9PEZI|nr:hypothetical protein L211DRAFT_479351 [Terfezia boudieri ATCC MYA-4762]
MAIEAAQARLAIKMMRNPSVMGDTILGDDSIQEGYRTPIDVEVEDIGAKVEAEAEGVLSLGGRCSQIVVPTVDLQLNEKSAKEEWGLGSIKHVALVCPADEWSERRWSSWKQADDKEVVVDLVEDFLNL